MTWDFETPSDVQERLNWADSFVTAEVEPLDAIIPDPRDVSDLVRATLVPPLQQAVKDSGLWATHVRRTENDANVGFVETALLNEILGRSRCAPTVFGCQAPDAGNMEILAEFASDAQKERFLAPLMEGRIVSAFSATEPQGGADPTMYETAAARSDGAWVVNGEKFFISGAEYAAFHLVMVVTDPDAPRHRRMSLFIVPRDTDGVEFVDRHHQVGQEQGEHHSHVRYNSVRVADELMVGEPGDGFRIMQARMGIARLFLAMRAVGGLRVALQMMCERALSRRSQDERLADKQLVQAMIADSWLEIEQFRLLVLRTAWKLERVGNSRSMRSDIAAVKVLTGRVVQSVAHRAIQIHGALGVSQQLPLMDLLLDGITWGVADGPTEVHLITLAKDVLAEHRPYEGVFPDRLASRRRAAAEEKYATALAALAR